MGKNIALLYMSAYFAQPAPEGSKNRFLRTQTNEAAVSALWKDPASRPDKIVALCSDTVRTKPTVPAADGSGNKVPTLEYFRDEFLKQLGVQPEQLVAVSVPDSMEEADQTRAISAVLEQVAEAVGSDPEGHCGAGNRILPERAAVPQPDQPRHGQRG